MLLWSKIWSVLDRYVLWMLDSDGDALIRDVAQPLPNDPREQKLLAQAADCDRTAA